MINAYNRMQLLKSALLLVGALACYAMAWLFFRYGLAVVFHGFKLPSGAVPWLSLGALGAVTWGGWRQWQKGNGFTSYLESSLFHDLGDDSGGGFMLDRYAHRVTGPAYVLGQVFLGGPLLLLRAAKHLRQRLPNSAGMEPRLHSTLLVLREANKWQSISEYPDLRLEILMLAQMRKIDFSTHTGTFRIKAPAPHGI